MKTGNELKEQQSYPDLYSWSNIWEAGLYHNSLKHFLKHLVYAGGWKKFEPLWSLHKIRYIE
jgi:hypothetical protein